MSQQFYRRITPYICQAVYLSSYVCQAEPLQGSPPICPANSGASPITLEQHGEEDIFGLLQQAVLLWMEILPPMGIVGLIQSKSLYKLPLAQYLGIKLGVMICHCFADLYIAAALGPDSDQGHSTREGGGQQFSHINFHTPIPGALREMVCKCSWLSVCGFIEKFGPIATIF